MHPDKRDTQLNNNNNPTGISWKMDLADCIPTQLRPPPGGITSSGAEDLEVTVDARTQTVTRREPPGLGTAS